MNANLRAVSAGSTSDARLDRLTPAERSVFVLRVAFSHGYREIAETLGLTETACRQLHRHAERRLATHGRIEEAGTGAQRDPACPVCPAQAA